MDNTLLIYLCFQSYRAEDTCCLFPLCVGSVTVELQRETKHWKSPPSSNAIFILHPISTSVILLFRVSDEKIFAHVMFVHVFELFVCCYFYHRTASAETGVQVSYWFVCLCLLSVQTQPGRQLRCCSYYWLRVGQQNLLITYLFIWHFYPKCLTISAFNHEDNHEAKSYCM